MVLLGSALLALVGAEVAKAASAPIVVEPSEQATMPNMAARTNVLVDSCGDGQPHAGPTYSSFTIHPPEVATLVGGKPSVDAIRNGGATASIAVSRTAKPGLVFIVEWGAVADGCYSAHGSVTFVVGTTAERGGPVVKPTDPAAACKTKKNFWGWNAKERAWWAKVAKEARRRAQVAADWGEFFDLFTWLSKLPGMNDPDLKNALNVLNVIEAELQGVKLAVEKAEKKVATEQASVNAIEAAQSTVSRQINRLTTRPGKKGPRALNAAERAQLAQLKQQQVALGSKLRTAQASLKQAKAAFSALNAQMKSKAFDPFIDRLLGSTKPALKALGGTLNLMNFGQAGAAVGLTGFAALAAYANKASTPPRGCSR